MLVIVIDPCRLVDLDAFSGEISRYVDFVKSAKKVSPDAEILVPGEIEKRTRARRLEEGIEIEDETRNQLLEVCRTLKVSSDIKGFLET